MTNPSPRPALRKADDHAVHPAAPVEPVVAPPAAPAVAAPPAVPTPSSLPAPPRRRGKRRAGRATSDTLRPVPRSAPSEVVPPGGKGGKKKGKKKGRSESATATPVPAPGSTVALVIAVDAGLAGRLEARAADLGLRREQAVEQLVRAWVDG